jgi:hemerythrin-like domain-containing protein
MGPEFEAIRREHRQFLDAVHKLERGCATGVPAGAVATAAGAFLDVFESAIEPHAQREEADVYPMLEQYLPKEVGSADAMLREHETLRSLAAFMKQARARLRAGDAAAAAELRTLASDLALLLRDHIRKEDAVINPLLERILRRVHV